MLPSSEAGSWQMPCWPPMSRIDSHLVKDVARNKKPKKPVCYQTTWPARDSQRDNGITIRFDDEIPDLVTGSPSLSPSLPMTRGSASLSHCHPPHHPPSSGRHMQLDIREYRSSSRACGCGVSRGEGWPRCPCPKRSRPGTLQS